MRVNLPDRPSARLLRRGLSLIILLILVAACGNQAPPTIPAVLELPTVTPVPPTDTPVALPPTWTPSPVPTVACGVVISNTGASTASTCGGLNVGEACFVSGPAGLAVQAGAALPTFGTPGDRVALAQVRSIQTLSYNNTANTWSLVQYNVQADPPGVAPGQWVSVVQFGEVVVTDAGGASGPFQNMTVVTGYEDALCGNAPLPAIMIQNNTLEPAGVRVNNLALRFVGTVLVRAQANSQMAVVVISGDTEVTAPDNSGVIEAPAGTELHVMLGGADGLQATSDLSLVPLNNSLLSNIPLNALPQAVAIGPPVLETRAPEQVAGLGLVPPTETATPTITPDVPFVGTPPDGLKTYSGKRIQLGATVTGTVSAEGRDAWVFEPVGMAPDSFDSFEVSALGEWDPVITIESATWGPFEVDYNLSNSRIEAYTHSLAGSGGDWRIVIRDASGVGGGYTLRYTCQGQCQAAE